MMRVLIVVLLGFCVAAVASAQSSDEALRARRAQQVKPPSDVRFFVFTSAPPETGLVPADYQDRVDSTKDATRILIARLYRVVSKRVEAEVLVEVTGRTLVSAEDDIYDVRATITVLGQRVEMTGHVEDGNWSDAAGDLVNKVAKLIKVNEQRILAARK